MTITPHLFEAYLKCADEMLASGCWRSCDPVSWTLTSSRQVAVRDVAMDFRRLCLDANSRLQFLYRA